MATGQARWDGPRTPAGYAASKVPLITAYFWIIKLLSTAMGEATSDYMVRIMNPVIAVLLGAAGWAIAMALVFRAKRYNAWIYWLGVVMVAVFGTMCADVLHIKFHVPYAASTTFYAIVLVVIFVLWYRSEGTLSIHSIRTPRRELFYWATVLATFALGTATGDMTAKTLNLGYLASGIWFSLAFAAVAVAHWKFGLNSIVAFWAAYVLTRPVGASFADYVAFPRSAGGLDVGHAEVALVLTFFIVCLVGYVARTRLDVEKEPDASRSPAPTRYRPGAEAAGGFWPESYEAPAGRRPGEGQRYDPRSHEARSYDARPHGQQPPHEQRPYEQRPYEQRRYDDRRQYEPSAYDPRSPGQQPHDDRRSYEPSAYDRRSYEQQPSDRRSYEPRSYDSRPSQPRPADHRPYEPPSYSPRSSEPRPHDQRSHDRRSYEPRSYDSGDSRAPGPRPYEPRSRESRSAERRRAERRPLAPRRQRDADYAEDPAEQTQEGFFMWDDQ